LIFFFRSSRPSGVQDLYAPTCSEFSGDKVRVEVSSTFSTISISSALSTSSACSTTSVSSSLPQLLAAGAGTSTLPLLLPACYYSKVRVKVTLLGADRMLCPEVLAFRPTPRTRDLLVNESVSQSSLVWISAVVNFAEWVCAGTKALVKPVAAWRAAALST